MSRILRLGLLGTGVAARQLYLPAFRALTRRVEVVACASRRRKSAEAYARLAGIPKVVDDADELFALPEVDAVFISLPIDTQPEYVARALARGKAVLSEKPVGPSVATGRRLLKTAQRFAQPWLVAENYACMPAVQRLAAWVAEGRLGEVRLALARQMTWMDAKNPYFDTRWRRDPAHLGGFISDGGVHLARVVRLCCGMPLRVQGKTALFDRALSPMDTAVATLEFPSGALGTWTSCYSARYEGPLLELYGSRANATLSWNTATLCPARGKPVRFETNEDSFRLQLLHFADVVKRGAQSLLTPEDALEDLVLVDAITGGSRLRRRAR